MEFGLDKSKEALLGMVQGTVDFGKKIVSTAKESSLARAERKKAEAIEKDLKKYNPLFLEDLEQKAFHLPAVIVVADDIERRDIEVCKGAIGWRSSENGTEILWIYDKDTDILGVKFIPAKQHKGIYHVDQFDPSRYILASQIFSKAQDEKIAELERIAACLGAKKYIIDIQEYSQSNNQQNQKGNIGSVFKGFKANASMEENRMANELTKNTFHTESKLRGSFWPKRPELKWFAHTDTILELIDNRCNNRNAVKTKTLQISGSSIAAMTTDVALSIDAAVEKMGSLKAESTMTAKAASEYHSTLYFHVEF